MATTTDPRDRTTADHFQLPGSDLLDRGLDRVEEGLPALPAAVFRLQRSVAERIAYQGRHALCAVGGAVQATVDVGRNAGRTVTGTGRQATGEATDVATQGLRRTVGQTRAQAARVANAARGSGNDIADEIDDFATEAVATIADVADVADEAASNVAAVVHGTTVSYDHWTKADLYELAQELDIDGRSTMSKDELVAAIERTR